MSFRTIARALGRQTCAVRGSFALAAGVLLACTEGAPSGAGTRDTGPAPTHESPVGATAESPTSSAAHLVNPVPSGEVTGYVLEDGPGRFAVRFPGAGSAPTQQVQAIRSLDGPMSVTTYTVSRPQGAFFVTYNDYGAQALRELDERQVLDRARDALLATEGTTLEKESPIRLGGRAGRQLTYRRTIAGTAAYGRTEMLFVSPRLYQLHVVGTDPRAPVSPASNAFFESFRAVASGG